MPKRKQWPQLLTSALSAFCVYTCMYAFRKPFTAATYTGLSFLSIDYKVWLIIAQTIGYTASKFYGIRFIAELKANNRWKWILLFIGCSWISLYFFAIVPAPYNIIFLFLNGFPLGVIYGLVFSYLEGRRSTEFLGSVLTSSFIFASGFTQTIGKYVLIDLKVNQWWMPFITGALFIIPLLSFTWLLNKTPKPTEIDIEERTERISMNKFQRRAMISEFRSGIFLLILTYILLTIIRDYRTNFAADIWNELGFGNNTWVFTQSEIPAAIITFFIMSALILIRKNIFALMINHVIIILGLVVVLISTLLYTNHFISPFAWVATVGAGLYLSYVPFNCMLFDRLIATFKYAGNAGFIIYLADSFGYLGSDLVLIFKNLVRAHTSWNTFFIYMIYSFTAVGILLTLLSTVYFRNKYYSKNMAVPSLKYV